MQKDMTLCRDKLFPGSSKIFLRQHPPFPHALLWQIASVSLVRHAISSFAAVKDTLIRIQVIRADIRAETRANQLLGVLKLSTRTDFPSNVFSKKEMSFI